MDAKVYRNDSEDLLVKINGPEFLIIGDGDKVSDGELLAMARNETPEGWQYVGAGW